MTENHQGLDELEIGKELEKAMETFLANEGAINFGFVYSHEEAAQPGLPPRNVVVVLIHNPEKEKPLTDKLLELAQGAGLSVNSIEDLIKILREKGFSLIAQNEDAQSYQRARQILPLNAVDRLQRI